MNFIGKPGTLRPQISVGWTKLARAYYPLGHGLKASPRMYLANRKMRKATIPTAAIPIITSRNAVDLLSIHAPVSLA